MILPAISPSSRNGSIHFIASTKYPEHRGSTKIGGADASVGDGGLIAVRPVVRRAPSFGWACNWVERTLGCASPVTPGESGFFSFSISCSSSNSNADIESDSDIPRPRAASPSRPRCLALVSLKDPLEDPLRDLDNLSMSLPNRSGTEGLRGLTSFIDGRRDSAGVGGPSCP